MAGVITDRSGAPRVEVPELHVERFGRDDEGRLEVVGRWSGVRGRRFVRPALDVRLADGSARRLLAVLEHKPWAPDVAGAWIAAFPLEDAVAEVEGAELAVAPGVVVELAGPGVAGPAVAVAVHVASPTPARRFERTPETPREDDGDVDDDARERNAVARERDQAVDARDAAAQRLTQVRRERDEALAERDVAVAARDQAVSARDDATAAREDAVAAREERAATVREVEELRARVAALTAERDAALATPADPTPPDRTDELAAAQAEVAELRAQRDVAREQRDEAARERDAAVRRLQRTAPPEPDPELVARLERERDAAREEAERAHRQVSRDAFRHGRAQRVAAAAHRKVSPAAAARREARAIIARDENPGEPAATIWLSRALALTILFAALALAIVLLRVVV